MKPLYEPKGRAKEYGDYAINIDVTCPHKCFYCYCPTFLHKTKEEFFNYKGHRAGIVEAVKTQLEKENVTGKLIHLTFVGDPYPKGYDSSATREIIKFLKERGNHVQLLTKNGADAERDFDLLDGEDWFGVTYAGYDDIFNAPNSEPGAGAPLERIYALCNAHELGIKTWVSCEPVLDAENVYSLIKSFRFIDLFKIGKLNYFPSDINWGDFGRKCVELCEQYGRNYYIKDDLRKEMEYL